MKSTNRITFRFDGNGRAMNGQDAPGGNDGGGKAGNEGKSNVVPLYRHHAANDINELSPWHNPYLEDVGALERLIRESGEASGRSGRLEPRGFVTRGEAAVSLELLLRKLGFIYS